MRDERERKTIKMWTERVQDGKKRRKRNIWKERDKETGQEEGEIKGEK